MGSESIDFYPLRFYQSTLTPLVLDSDPIGFIDETIGDSAL